MKKFKGFTLIECLIAMFILGISSLLLVQGYTQLMRLTTRNNTINVSIGQQMADAEAAALTNSTLISGSGDESDFEVQKVTDNYMTVELMEISGNGAASADKRDYDTKMQYSTKMTVYIVSPYKSFNCPDTGSTGQKTYTEAEANKKDGTEMRYIYFHT